MQCVLKNGPHQQSGQLWQAPHVQRTGVVVQTNQRTSRKFTQTHVIQASCYFQTHSKICWNFVCNIFRIVSGMIFVRHPPRGPRASRRHRRTLAAPAPCQHSSAVAHPQRPSSVWRHWIYCRSHTVTIAWQQPSAKQTPNGNVNAMKRHTVCKAGKPKGNLRVCKRLRYTIGSLVHRGAANVGVHQHSTGPDIANGVRCDQGCRLWKFGNTRPARCVGRRGYTGTIQSHILSYKPQARRRRNQQGLWQFGTIIKHGLVTRHSK